MTGGKRDNVSANAAEGYWMDEYGAPVGPEIKARITDWDAKTEQRGGRGHLKIEGSLVKEGDKSKGQEDGRAGKKMKGKVKSALRKTTSGETSAAAANGDAMEIE